MLLLILAGAWGYGEYLGVFSQGRPPALPLSLGVGLGALPGIGAGVWGVGGLAAGLFAAVAAAGLLLLPRVAEDKALARQDLGAALAGLVLVPWMVAHAILILARPGGRFLLLFLVVLLVLNDTLAYFAGNLLGRTPLMPAVSPKKTVEGSLGGLAGGVLAGWLAGLSPAALESALSPGMLLFLGVFLAAAGQAGDLLESKFKRLNDVKDSGVFLPGHGGLLDRLDAFLLATPLLYYIGVPVG